MNDWQDAEDRVEKAQELFAQQKWQEALDELRAAIAMNPYNSSWYFNIGLTLDELGRFDEALEANTKALRIEPDDIEALHRMGIDLARLEKFEQALKTFDQITRRDSTYEPAYCEGIAVYAAMGNHEKAEETFYIARQYKEECPRCFFNIAHSLLERRLFDKAIYCWQRTLDLDEAYPSVHVHLAEALSLQGEFEKARQHYLQELRLNPGNTDALLDLGDLLLEMGRTDEAGEKFRRAIELAPAEPFTHVRYGRWLLICGRLDVARETISRALNLDARCPAAHLYLAEASAAMYYLAHAYQRQGDHEKALIWARRASEVDPRDPTIQRLELRIRLMRFFSTLARAFRKLLPW